MNDTKLPAGHLFAPIQQGMKAAVESARPAVADPETRRIDLMQPAVKRINRVNPYEDGLTYCPTQHRFI